MKQRIKELTLEFSSLVTKSRVALSKIEADNPEFLERFRDALLLLPVTLFEKPLHDRFFQGKEVQDIFTATSINQIFICLSRYWNYTNYGLLECVVDAFCPDLTEEVRKYWTALDSFERATTIDVFLLASPSSDNLSQKYTMMAAKLNKLPSECTLHDVRKLKNSLAQESGITSHSVYTVINGCGSVRLTLGIHPAAVVPVVAALTQEFLRRSHLTDVIIEGRPLHILHELDPADLVQSAIYMFTILLVHMQLHVYAHILYTFVELKHCTELIDLCSYLSLRMLSLPYSLIGNGICTQVSRRDWHRGLFSLSKFY